VGKGETARLGGGRQGYSRQGRKAIPLEGGSVEEELGAVVFVGIMGLMSRACKRV